MIFYQASNNRYKQASYNYSEGLIVLLFVKHGSIVIEVMY